MFLEKKKIVEQIKTNNFSSINFFFPENCAVYERMWKNMIQPERPQMKI
jgi:hypothetical protein